MEQRLDTNGQHCHVVLEDLFGSETKNSSGHEANKLIKKNQSKDTLKLILHFQKNHSISNQFGTNPSVREPTKLHLLYGSDFYVDEFKKYLHNLLKHRKNNTVHEFLDKNLKEDLSFLNEKCEVEINKRLVEWIIKTSSRGKDIRLEGEWKKIREAVLKAESQVLSECIKRKAEEDRNKFKRPKVDVDQHSLRTQSPNSASDMRSNRDFQREDPSRTKASAHVSSNETPQNTGQSETKPDVQPSISSNEIQMQVTETKPDVQPSICSNEIQMQVTETKPDVQPSICSNEIQRQVTETKLEGESLDISKTSQNVCMTETKSEKSPVDSNQFAVSGTKTKLEESPVCPNITSHDVCIPGAKPKEISVIEDQITKIKEIKLDEVCLSNIPEAKLKEESVAEIKPVEKSFVGCTETSDNVHQFNGQRSQLYEAISDNEKDEDVEKKKQPEQGAEKKEKSEKEKVSSKRNRDIFANPKTPDNVNVLRAKCISYLKTPREKSKSVDRPVRKDKEFGNRKSSNTDDMKKKIIFFGKYILNCRLLWDMNHNVGIRDIIYTMQTFR